MPPQTTFVNQINMKQGMEERLLLAVVIVLGVLLVFLRVVRR